MKTISPHVNIHIIDVCSSDYFRGHQLAVGTMPLDKYTVDAFIEEIKADEYVNEMYDEELLDKAISNFIDQFDSKDSIVVDITEIESIDEVYVYYVIGLLVNDPIIPNFRYVVNGLNTVNND